MLKQIGSEYQYLERKDKNSNVYKKTATIPTFATIRS